jgi:hypothetical protein
MAQAITSFQEAIHHNNAPKNSPNYVAKEDLQDLLDHAKYYYVWMKANCPKPQL